MHGNDVTDVQYCSRCGRQLARGEVTYSVSIALVADWKDRVADTGEQSLASYVGRLAHRIQGVPPALLEEEVHREIEGRLCLRCKEHFAANPFDSPVHRAAPSSE
jgi:hypothetical protein